MRILCWNIERFRSQQVDRHDFYLDTIQRVIYNVAPGSLQPWPPPPIDVFAILEVYQHTGRIGVPLPAGSAGTNAVLELYQQLRRHNAGNLVDWRLVPPLSTAIGGKSEGVAIFYNNATVEFLGPNKWSGNASLPPGRVNEDHNYSAPWDDAVPQPYYASRVQFYKDYATLQDEILFPDNSYRRPCMVKFRERGGNRRTYLVAFVHTTPPLKQNPNLAQNTAVRAMRNLVALPELRQPRNHNADGAIVIGDFNVNANVDPSRSRPPFQRATRQILSQGYSVMIDQNTGTNKPTAIRPPVGPKKRKRNRPPFRVPPNANISPQCDTYYWDKWSVDNVFWKAPGIAANPAHRYVVDPVIGNPATVVSQMEDTLAAINTPPPHARPGLWKYTQFTADRNYRKMIKLSDHLPLYFEI